MLSEFVVGPILITVGVILVIFRRPISRFYYRATKRAFGEPTADDWMGPGVALTRLLMAGIFGIVFGIVTICTALL